METSTLVSGVGLLLFFFISFLVVYEISKPFDEKKDANEDCCKLTFYDDGTLKTLKKGKEVKLKLKINEQKYLKEIINKLKNNTIDDEKDKHIDTVVKISWGND
jgi:hypothetical protein